MQREKTVASASPTDLAEPLRRRRRAVLVRVLVRGHEVDSFEVSEPRTLRAALRPVYAHLPAANAEVRFQSVDERWLPFGLGKRRLQTDLPSLVDALDFIAA